MERESVMHIRPANSDDAQAIWRIIGPTIRAGETYALDRDMSEAEALAYWMGEDRETLCRRSGDVSAAHLRRRGTSRVACD